MPSPQYSATFFLMIAKSVSIRACNLFFALAVALSLPACNEGKEQSETRKKIETDLELYQGTFRPPTPSPTASPGPTATPVPIPGAPVINPLPTSVSTNTFNVVGTGVSGTSVTLIINGTIGETVAVDETLSWLAPVGPLDDGPYSFTAIARFPGGEASDPSATVSTTVDTLAPSAPVITRPVLPSTTDKPTLEGTAEAGSTVTVSIDGSVNGTTTASGDGLWAYTVASSLANGSYSATATATDGAGNVSPASAAWPFEVDTVAPAAPVVTGPGGGLTNQNRPTISGTSEAEALVEVFSDGGSLGTTTADADGTWEYIPTDEFANGTYEITAQATDGGGLVSPMSAGFELTVDVSAPAAPVISGPAAVTDTRTPTINGTSIPDAVITVYLNGAVNGTGLSDGLGDWSYTVAGELANGNYVITAQATDGGGSLSPLSSPFSMDVEVPAP